MATRWILLLFCAALALFLVLLPFYEGTEEPAPSPPPPPDEPAPSARLQGRPSDPAARAEGLTVLVRDLSDRPVQAASVAWTTTAATVLDAVEQMRASSVVTGSDGEARLPPGLPGELAVVVKAPGYIAERRTVGPGQKRVEFHLGRTSLVEFLVLTTDGQAVPRAHVRVLMGRQQEFAWQNVDQATATATTLSEVADATGRVRMSAMLEADARVLMLGRSPDGDLVGAAPWREVIASGVLVLDSLRELRIHVVDTRGEQIENAASQASVGGEPVALVGRLSPNGDLLQPVPEAPVQGSVGIRITALHHTPVDLFGPFASDHLTVRLQDAEPVRFRILDATSREPVRSGAVVRLYGMSTAPRPPLLAQAADQNGVAVLHLPAGSRDSGLPRWTITWSSPAHVTGSLDVPPWPSGDPVTLLADPGRLLEVSVAYTNGEPAAGVRVLIEDLQDVGSARWVVGTPSNLNRPVFQSGDAGTIPAIRVNTGYSLAVTAVGQDGECVQELINAGATDVSLALTLPPRRAIAVRVLDERGDPIEGARVRLAGVDGFSTQLELRHLQSGGGVPTSSRGITSVPAYQNRAGVVQVEAAGFIGQRQEYDEDASRLEFRLRNSASIRGTVLGYEILNGRLEVRANALVDTNDPLSPEIRTGTGTRYAVVGTNGEFSLDGLLPGVPYSLGLKNGLAVPRRVTAPAKGIILHLGSFDARPIRFRLVGLDGERQVHAITATCYYEDKQGRVRKVVQTAVPSHDRVVTYLLPEGDIWVFLDELSSFPYSTWLRNDPETGEVEAELQRQDRVRVRVLDEEGFPVNRALVTLVGPRPEDALGWFGASALPRGLRSELSNEDGYADLPAPPSGMWTLWAEQGARRSERLQGRGPQEDTLDLVLRTETPAASDR